MSIFNYTCSVVSGVTTMGVMGDWSPTKFKVTENVTHHFLNGHPQSPMGDPSWVSQGLRVTDYQIATIPITPFSKVFGEIPG